ncbi:Scr1 family TA system antitoxin-like transcriptional regulator [Streptomyces griseoincarnatus]
MGRKDRLRLSDRPEPCVILDEAVLRRPIGGAVVMRKRLERLLDATGPTASLSARPPWAASARPHSPPENALHSCE